MFSFRNINWLNILLGINLLLFIPLAFISQGFRYESDLILVGALSTDFVFRGYPWLLVTANFLHFNIFHFIFNAFSLINLGRIVNEFFSNKVILIVYIFTGIAGSLLTVIMANITEAPMISIGASGSIFGLAGLLVGGTLKRQRYGFGLPFNFTDIIFPIGASFLIGLVPGLGVNNWAHLGGFLAGLGMGFLIKNQTGEMISERYLKIENIFYYIALVIFILSFFLLLFSAVSSIFL